MKRFLPILGLAFLLSACGGDTGSRSTDASEVSVPRVSGVLSTRQAKQLFGGMDNASSQSPAAYGSYAKGCAAG